MRLSLDSFKKYRYPRFLEALGISYFLDVSGLVGLREVQSTELC